MSDGPTTNVQELDPRPRGASADALDVLARALRGRLVTARTLRAAGRRPSPGEGVALVQDFIAIEDADLRQALLDVAAALSGRAG